MEKEGKDRKGDSSHSRGAIYIVGIGPGSLDDLTQRAKKAIEVSDAVVGYRRYVGLIAPLVGDREVFSTGMTEEVKRCRKAIDLAREGKNVAVISSGDAGIYGMAGLILELLHTPSYSSLSCCPGVQVIPGVPAFCAAAALAGAPIMHDFASISLSDLLTPWDIIEKRIRAASSADFVIILYNPKSRKRKNHLMNALEIIMAERGGDTPAAVVRDATRKMEDVNITTLSKISNCYDAIGMNTIVIVGNSSSYTQDGRMITPRGYRI